MNKFLYITLLILISLFGKSSFAAGDLVIDVVQPLSFPAGFAGLNDVTIVAPFDRGAPILKISGGKAFEPFYFIVPEEPSLCLEEQCIVIKSITYGGPTRFDARGEAVVSLGGKVYTTADLRGGTYRSTNMKLAISARPFTFVK